MNDIGELLSFQGRLYFPATDRTGDRELWSSDGTAAGLRPVANVYPAGSSLPEMLTVVGDRIVFRAFSANGQEPWVTDGTSAGTRELVDTAPGPAHGRPYLFTAHGNQVFFLSFGDLWGADVLTLTAREAPITGRAVHLTVANGTAYAYVDAAFSLFLVRIDGLAQGTTVIANERPGQLRSTAQVPGRGGMLYGTVGLGTSDVHFTDGTTTAVVCSTGGGASVPRDLTICDGGVYFLAEDGIHGEELMRLQGEPGTVETLGAGCGPRAPRIESGDFMTGRSGTLRGENPTGNPGWLLVGFVGGPTVIPGLLAPDCCLWANLNGVALVPQPAGSRWSRSFPVPPGLAGQRLVVQAVYGPGPLALSNGLQIYVGN